MSTTYYAVPLKVLIDAGINDLFIKSPRDRIEEALRLMTKPGDSHRGYDIDHPRHRDEVGGVIELGIHSNEFMPSLDREQLETILSDDHTYLILDEFREYQKPSAFREQLKKWGYR